LSGRRLKFKSFRRFLYSFAGVCLAYGFFVEPEWIEISRHVVEAPLSRSIRIAHLTDLHVRSIRRREEKLLGLLAQERPDLIVITGDSISGNEDYAPVDAFFDRLRAPLGVYIIEGNWERWHPRPPEYPARDRGDLHFLKNAIAVPTPGLSILGFVDGLNEMKEDTLPPKWPLGTKFRIGLLHSPADFDRIAPDFDLVLAGHTHGGQIRLPFLPPVFLPHGSGKYLAGWYDASAARMYVSRGIGNSLIEARFFARPEFAIFDLVPITAR